MNAKASTARNKRPHHFIPVAYLQHFTYADGKIFAYLKHTDHREPIHTLPKAVALTNDYYAQPKPDGTTDYNSIENMFAGVEAKWPALVRRIEARENFNDELEYIFEFLAAMRVRVPAARDAAETIDREGVKATMLSLERRGLLPPMPKGLTQDQIDVVINPHQSIHAMPQMARGFAIVVDMLGFESRRPNGIRRDHAPPVHTNHATCQHRRKWEHARAAARPDRLARLSPPVSR